MTGHGNLEGKKRVASQLVAKQLEYLQTLALTPRVVGNTDEQTFLVAELEAELSLARARVVELEQQTKEVARDLETALQVIERLDSRNKQLEHANERLKRSLIRVSLFRVLLANGWRV